MKCPQNLKETKLFFSVIKSYILLIVQYKILWKSSLDFKILINVYVLNSSRIAIVSELVHMFIKDQADDHLLVLDFCRCAEHPLVTFSWYILFCWVVVFLTFTQFPFSVLPISTCLFECTLRTSWVTAKTLLYTSYVCNFNTGIILYTALPSSKYNMMRKHDNMTTYRTEKEYR